MIQIKERSRSKDDPDRGMIQIQEWCYRWSRSSDDPDPVMMIQIQRWRWLEDKEDLKMKMTWRQRRLEEEDDLKMQMMRRPREEDQWWKLCQENTFLVKRECQCKCNFRMYSLVFLIYCNLMFILGCSCIMSFLNFPIERINNVNKSCQVIVGNPPIV